MKFFFKIIAICFALGTAVILFNTFSITSKQITDNQETTKINVSDSVVHHLSRAIQFRTVSYADPTMLDSLQFEKFLAYLEVTFPMVYANLHHERINSYALLFEWKGKNESLKPALLMGHYDVVPVIQGTEKLWEHPPFGGEMVENYVYGRGSLDDKSTVMGILEAVEQLLKSGFQPERSFYLAFGHDEEVLGINGGKAISSMLEKRNVTLEYVIDEGGMIKQDGVIGLKSAIALIGIAEKGYVTLQLTTTGEGGHSSMPPPKTSIGDLAEAIDRLQKSPFQASLHGAAEYMMDYLAPEMPFATKLAMSNRWLFHSLIINNLEKTNAGNAMVRTTIAPTIIDAGLKENVLPIDARAVVNFRILPGHSVDDVIRHAKDAIKNEHIKIEVLGGSGTEPSFVSDTATVGFRLIHATIKRCFSDVMVAPYLVVGGTDSRYFKNISKNIYRFMPVRFTDDDIKRFHGTNERIHTEDFKNVVRFYIELIKSN